MSMPPVQREMFLLHVETREYLQRIWQAEENIRVALERLDQPYLSFSGGKDSTVLLHLVLQQDPEIMMFHWDYGRHYIPREIASEFLENARKIGAKKIRVESSSLYEKEGREAINILGRIMLGTVIPQLRREGYDGAFIGLRAEESSKRKARTANIFETSKGITNVFPISHLTVRDVWGYILSKGLPYSSYYDHYSKLISYEQLRLVTFFDPEFERLGNPYLDGIMMPEFRNL